MSFDNICTICHDTCYNNYIKPGCCGYNHNIHYECYNTYVKYTKYDSNSSNTLCPICRQVLPYKKDKKYLPLLLYGINIYGYLITNTILLFYLCAYGVKNYDLYKDSNKIKQNIFFGKSNIIYNGIVHNLFAFCHLLLLYKAPLYTIYMPTKKKIITYIVLYLYSYERLYSKYLSYKYFEIILFLIVVFNSFKLCRIIIQRIQKHHTILNLLSILFIYQTCFNVLPFYTVYDSIQLYVNNNGLSNVIDFSFKMITMRYWYSLYKLYTNFSIDSNIYLSQCISLLFLNILYWFIGHPYLNIISYLSIYGMFICFSIKSMINIYNILDTYIMTKLDQFDQNVIPINCKKY